MVIKNTINILQAIWYRLYNDNDKLLTLFGVTVEVWYVAGAYNATLDIHSDI